MRVIKWLDEHLEETILVLLLIIISCVMMAQIIARYVFNDSMSWPEEFSRYCYIWTVFLSLGFTLKKGSMLRVGLVMDMLPIKVRNSIKIVTDLIMLVIFVIFFIHSVEVTKNIELTGQTSPAMQLPMWIMYCSTVIGFFLATIRIVQVIVHGIRHFKDRQISTLEATLKEAQDELSLVNRGVK